MDQYYARSVVWASARGDIFWPGQVIESDKDAAIPAKNHVTIKFLIEDSYEDIRNPNKICTWNCEKQDAFILKGRALKNAERKIQFNKAVAKADNLFMLQAKKGVNMSLHEDVSITKSPPETGSNKKIRNSGPRSGLILRTSPRIKMAKQNFTSNAADKSAQEQAQPTKTITANFEIKLDSATCTREALKRTSPASRLQTESKVTDSNSLTPNVKRRRTSPRQSKNLTSVEKNGETSDCLQAQYNGHQKSKAKRQLLEDESPKKGASSKKVKPCYHIGKTMENNKSIEQSGQRTLNVRHENGIGTNELRMSSENRNSEHGSGVADKESEAAVGINSSASSDGSSDDELLSEPFSPSQEANRFSVGDIVWAKYSREPYWPALIKKITGKRKRTLSLRCDFLVGMIACSESSPTS
ncbi:hypothetical protein OS493_016489 [Desmophyllum pertusum]|uniref:PWWP domain-containing protein n=1 Tax=Desmophyllum pertusum TaxID=174260 RepID=A0A9W9ZQ90_9CNID|nr:hypothetical protein OS493_016489 [Desmophyllum pertusum]